MNPITLIFKLLLKFVDFEGDEWGKASREGKEWYEAITYEDGWKGKAKKWCDMWYGKVALAISYIILIRVVADYINPPKDEDEEE